MSKTPDEVEQERHCRELLHRRMERLGCRELRRVPGDGQGGPLRDGCGRPRRLSLSASGQSTRRVPVHAFGR